MADDGSPAPDPGAPAARPAIAALIAQWRVEADKLDPNGVMLDVSMSWYDVEAMRTTTLNACADELDAALRAGADDRAPAPREDKEQNDGIVQQMRNREALGAPVSEVRALGQQARQLAASIERVNANTLKALFAFLGPHVTTRIDAEVEIERLRAAALDAAPSPLLAEINALLTWWSTDHTADPVSAMQRLMAIRDQLAGVAGTVPPSARCANCDHIEPHTKSTAGGGSNDPYDGCTHPSCSCGFDSRSHSVDYLAVPPSAPAWQRTLFQRILAYRRASENVPINRSDWELHAPVKLLEKDFTAKAAFVDLMIFICHGIAERELDAVAPPLEDA